MKKSLNDVSFWKLQQQINLRYKVSLSTLSLLIDIFALFYQNLTHLEWQSIIGFQLSYF